VVTTALPVRDFTKGYLVQYTRRGLVKRTPLEDYSNPRSTGIIALTLKEGDELIAVSLTEGSSDLFMSTRGGLAIRFPEEDVRSMGRTATGVIGIRLREGDKVVSAGVAYPRTSLLTVTERGMGKRTRIEDYPTQGRGGKGVINIKLSKKGGKAVGVLRVRDDDDVVMISNAGKIIRTGAADISLLGRNTQGVRVMDVNHEDRIVSVGRVAEKD
jgi:DNA gyrase subunit A